MPPANQGSKGALITWTVVSTVFGILMAVLALVFYTAKNNAETRRDTDFSRISEIANENDMTAAQVQNLSAQMKVAGNTNMRLLPYAISEMSEMGNRAAGQPDPTAAIDTIDTAINQVNQELDGGQARSLVEATQAAISEIQSLRNEIATLEETNSDLEGNLARQQQSNEQQLAAVNTSLEEARQKLQEQTAVAQQNLETLETFATQIEGLVSSQVSTAYASRDEATDNAQGFAAQIRTLTEQLAKATSRVATARRWRPDDHPARRPGASQPQRWAPHDRSRSPQRYCSGSDVRGLRPGERHPGCDGRPGCRQLRAAAW